MSNNMQSRKWALVINNPQEANLDHPAIIQILHRFAPDYFCLSDEISKTGTYHTHIFLFSNSPIRFSTLKTRFPIAHIEKAYGSAQENRDYIRKDGKWKDTEKSETVVPDTFFEWGHIPDIREEKAPKLFQLIQDVQAGISTTDILHNTPDFAFRVRDIDILRQALLAERFSSENRDIEVSYLYGKSGVGKTRSIYARYEARNICRVTNYRIGKGISFDNYTCQDVLVFEEFYSQVPIADMLNYLDIYPLYLPARYTDRVACYHHVYITSNAPLEYQYSDIQESRPATWAAFLRRIHNVCEFLEDGTIIFHKGGTTDVS